MGKKFPPKLAGSSLTYCTFTQVIVAIIQMISWKTSITGLRSYQKVLHFDFSYNLSAFFTITSKQLLLNFVDVMVQNDEQKDFQISTLNLSHR